MIKAGMSVAEAILQLTRGFEKVMGRKPDGLEKIKIQQEAVQRLKNLEKVVDMQGNVIDTSKGIIGGRQIQENKEFGKALREYLMRTDNPYSDLVKETKKGPKTLEQRRKEAEEALKNKNVTPIKDPEDMAQGGRAGFNVGGAPSIKYDFDREGPGPMGPPFETDDPEEAIKEIARRVILSEPGLRSEGAKIPISKFGSITIPDVDKIGARGSLNLLGGFLDFGAQKDFGTGEKGIGINFMKKFGGPKDKRVNRKEGGGMSRRQFMKIMGGIASLPFIGKFFKGAKPAAKVADVVTKTTKAGQPPEYFFDLAAKIKVLGKESKVSPRERVREIDYKNYSLQEDLTTGDMTIVKRKGDPEFNYEEEVMVLRKGQADEMTKGKIPPDEYEELTVRPDMDGKMKDVEDGIEPESVKEIMEEVGQGGGNLDQTTLEEIARGRLASGGRASFSKGGIRTYLKNLLNFLAEKEGLKGSDQLRVLNPKSFPRKIRSRMTAKQLKDVEANRAEYLEGLLDMLESDKRNLTKMKGTADQVFKESMREAVASGDTEKIKLIKTAGRDLIRAQQERGIPYLKILRQFEDTNIDDTIAEGQKMLKDFQIKKGLRKLNASGGVAMMLGE